MNFFNVFQNVFVLWRLWHMRVWWQGVSISFRCWQTATKSWTMWFGFTCLPPPDARRGRGYKNFSILCLRQDVRRTHAMTHEILRTCATGINYDTDICTDITTDTDTYSQRVVFFQDTNSVLKQVSLVSAALFRCVVGCRRHSNQDTVDTAAWYWIQENTA